MTGEVEVRLIDFGLAVTSRKCEGQYVGTTAYSPQRHLTAFRNSDSCTFDASTDLQSLVKTWIILSVREEARRAVLTWSDDCMNQGSLSVVKLFDWWSAALSLSPLFQRCYEAAENVDYNEVKRLFGETCLLD